jgi:hypothetical protein
MTIVGNLALLAVIALTLCVVPIWQSIPNPGGPDRAAVAINPILCGARWFLLSIVLAICAARGAFSAWAVALLIAVYFVFEMIAAFCMAGQAFGLPGLLSKATVLIPLTLPAPLVAYTFWWLNLRPAGFTMGARGTAIWGSTAIATLGILAFVCGAMTDNRKADDPAAKVQREVERYRTIARDSDVETLLRFLEPSILPEVRALAVADLAARSDVITSLSRVFASGSVRDGSRAARLLPELKSASAAGLLDPFRKFADRTVELLSSVDVSLDFQGCVEHAESVLIGARALGTHELDGQLKRLRTILNRYPDERTAAMSSEIESFLNQ